MSFAAFLLGEKCEKKFGAPFSLKIEQKMSLSAQSFTRQSRKQVLFAFLDGEQQENELGAPFFLKNSEKMSFAANCRAKTISKD